MKEVKFKYRIREDIYNGISIFTPQYKKLIFWNDIPMNSEWWSFTEEYDIALEACENHKIENSSPKKRKIKLENVIYHTVNLN